jgi:hypothetical protein
MNYFASLSGNKKTSTLYLQLMYDQELWVHTMPKVEQKIPNNNINGMAFLLTV